MKDFALVFPRRAPYLTTAIVASVFFLIGCGGGSSSPSPLPSASPSPVPSPSPTVSARAAVIDSVKGARRAAVLFGTSSRVLGRSESGEKAGMSAARRIIVYAQKVKKERTRQVGLEFDETTGLYMGVREIEGGFRWNYFEDAAGKNPAGFIEIKETGEQTVQMVFDLPKGQQASQGTLTLTSEDAKGTTGTIKGDLTDPNTGDKIVLDLFFKPGNGAEDVSVNGSFSVSDTDGTIAFRNLSADDDGSMSVEVLWNGVPGELSGNADESGFLVLGTGPSALRAEWNASGAGRIILQDGTVINIADFDTADGEG